MLNQYISSAGLVSAAAVKFNSRFNAMPVPKKLWHNVTFAAMLSVAVFGSPAVFAAASGHAAANLAAVNINDGFAKLVAAVNPAVVNISVTGSVKSSRNIPGYNGKQLPPSLQEFFKRFGNPNGAPDSKNNNPFERKTKAVGSGFIIDPSGLVVTNNHVIADADAIEVVFEDGTRIPATLKGTDSKTDLALLQIERDSPFPFVKFGDSETARVGDWVVAIGNPFGLGGTTTKGIISARGRDIRAGPLDDFIQIDAPVNRGNSGGPLFNMRGEVIGINTLIYSPNGGSVGIAFAIPSALASNVISQLRDTGTVQRGYLGVHILSVSKEIAKSLGLDKVRGALVTQIIADSPAEAAGIKAGDIILSFNNKPILNMRALPKVVASTKTSKKVDIVVWRNQKKKTIRVSIGGNADDKTVAAKANSEAGKLGLSLAELSAKNRNRFALSDNITGVLITAVNAGSVAAKKGLARGELIKKIGNLEVTTPKQVEAAIAEAKSDNKSILLLIERKARVRYVVVPLEAE